MDFALLFIVVLVFPLYTIEQSTNVSVYGRSNSTIILNSTLTRDGNPIQWRFNTLQYTSDLKINPYLPNDTRNRLTVVNNYDLRITNFQTEDEGKYTCSTNYMGSLRIHTVNLALLKQPRLLAFRNASIANKLIGTEGQDLLIECIAVGGQPAPALSLVVLGTTVQTGVQELRYILRNIPRIYDTTNVSCEANSDALDIPMTTTALIYLTLMPLMPMLSAPFVNTLEMVPFSISCTSTGSRPAAAIWWMIGQTDVTITGSSQENKVVDETFTVTSTLTYMVGRKFNLQPIICTANNTIGGFSNQINLFVRFPPNVFVSNVSYEMTDPKRTINCTADGYPDTYTFYKWQHRSLHEHIIRELDGDTILTLPVVPITLRYQDNGEYVCTVSNDIQGTDGVEKRQGAAQITVYAQPVFTADNEERNIQYGEIGKTVDIVVHVFSVPKYIYNAWFNNGKQIQTSTKFLISESSVEVEDIFHGKSVKVDGYKSILTINSLTIEDFTNYTLILENGIGKSVEHTVILERPRSNKNRDQSTTKHYEALGLQDVPNAYDNLSNEAPRANRDLSPSRNYEKLGLKDAPNVYEDLTDKDSKEIGGQSTTRHYDALGQKEAPNVYNELTNEAHYENRSQSSGKHYEDLGRKNAAYVYDDLKSEACKEATANSPTIHYEELGVKNNPTVYDDLIN